MDNNKKFMESKGATVEEAVSEALLQLGARRDEVEIEVVNEAKGGLLGIFGKKQAVVHVRRVSKRRQRPSDRRGRRAASVDRKPEQRTPEKGGARRDAKKSEDDQRRDGGRPAPDRDRDRDQDKPSRGRRGSRRPRPDRRDEGQANPEASAEKTSRQPEPRKAPESRRRPEPRREREPAPRPEAESPAPETDTAEVQPTRRERKAELQAATAVGEAIKAASVVAPEPSAGMDKASELQKMFCEKLLFLSGFTGRCDVTEDEYNQVKVVVDADSAGILIGRHGYTIDAIEHLVERMTTRVVGERARMNLDINNYRRRREGKLVGMAQDAMARVRQSGAEDHLPGMSPRDRRIVHMEVAKEEALDTYTAGQGMDRHVVVVPASERKDGPEDEKPAEKPTEKPPEKPVEDPAGGAPGDAGPVEAEAAETGTEDETESGI